MTEPGGIQTIGHSALGGNPMEERYLREKSTVLGKIINATEENVRQQRRKIKVNQDHNSKGAGASCGSKRFRLDASNDWSESPHGNVHYVQDLLSKNEV